jgi:hypothetical protein
VVIKYVRKGATGDGRRLSVGVLNGNSRNAMIAATAQVLGLQLSAVSIVSEEEIGEAVNDLSTVAVVFRILAKDPDFSELQFASPRELFTAVTNKLSLTLSSGAFNAALATAAEQYHAVELMTDAAQVDLTVTVAPPTFTEDDTYDPMDAGLSTGEYAGIVIGVLVGLWCCLAACGLQSRVSAVRGDRYHQSCANQRTELYICVSSVYYSVC